MDYITYRCTNIVLLFHTTYISVDLAHHKIFHGKVDKGGIKRVSQLNILSVSEKLPVSKFRYYTVLWLLLHVASCFWSKTDWFGG